MKLSALSIKNIAGIVQSALKPIIKKEEIDKMLPIISTSNEPKTTDNKDEYDVPVLEVEGSKEPDLDSGKRPIIKFLLHPRLSSPIAQRFEKSVEDHVNDFYDLRDSMYDRDIMLNYPVDKPSLIKRSTAKPQGFKFLEVGSYGEFDTKKEHKRYIGISYYHYLSHPEKINENSVTIRFHWHGFIEDGYFETKFIPIYLLNTGEFLDIIAEYFRGNIDPVAPDGELTEEELIQWKLDTFKRRKKFIEDINKHTSEATEPLPLIEEKESLFKKVVAGAKQLVERIAGNFDED